jgi:hypothetical protein
MTNAKHTPGPWQTDGCHIKANGIRIAFAVNDVDEAVSGRDFEGYPRPQEAFANARLIATAPELLEALNECHGALWRLLMVTDISTRGGDLVEYYHRGQSANKKALAAIAKAKGEAA